ncbi:MAG TPA: DNA polymerase III subunit delta [Solirubrobacteraceae bacterium]
MSKLGPAYLIHGDDHGAVAERRAGLHALADGEGDAASVECLDGETGTPQALARALQVMTFALGRRVIIVDGVERWKDTEVKEHLLGAMSEMPPDTTVALFAREEPRSKVPAAVHDAVKRAGGQIVAQMNVKPWELPRWVCERAAQMGLALDTEAAKVLVGQVGERQQRLLRELEKLALDRSGTDSRQPLGAQDIEQRAAHSQQARIYGLANALIGGDLPAAMRCYLALRDQGERLAGCLYLISQSLRDGLAVAVRLQAGEPAGEIKRSLRMPARAADRFIADVRRSSPERLRLTLAALADLELDSRGGAILTSARSAGAALAEDTLALRSLPLITA